jgi:hypothetical protein
MQITRNTLDTGPGPGDWFTGSVYIDAITVRRWRMRTHMLRLRER